MYVYSASKYIMSCICFIKYIMQSCIKMSFNLFHIDDECNSNIGLKKPRLLREMRFSPSVNYLKTHEVR